MSNLTQLVQRYSIRHDRKLKKLCTPLKDSFGIEVFEYYTISADGHFGILSTYTEQLDFYYSEKLYLDEPYLRHPHFFRSGYTFIPSIASPEYQDISMSRFQLNNLFLKLERNGDHLEGYLFGTLAMDALKGMSLIPYLDALSKFTRYFKRESTILIERMNEDTFNLQKAKGDAFLDRSKKVALSSSDVNITNLLDQVLPLTKREQECLNLFKQGKTSQSTAAILGLSHRTVEYYFENIKTKLGCFSKWDLLNY